MEPKQDIKIVRLAEGDAQFGSDHLANFSSMVLSCEGMYPGIDKWIKKKVIPGIKSKERAAFVGYLNDKPVVTAVAKKGVDAKICHLNISPELQNTNLGEVFFSLLGIELRPFASNLHFTLPESLWERKHSFFESFGFEGVSTAPLQYRLFDQELRSQANFGNFWKQVLHKMPKLASLYSLGGFSLDSQLLLSLQPKYSQAILNGTKTVEIRRRFSSRWVNCRANIYETAPTMGLVGEVSISGVEEGKPESIWLRHQDQIGCSKEDFINYTADCESVFAIKLSDPHRYKNEVFLSWAEQMLEVDLHPPQSYLTLENNKPWAEAISLAAYMQSCIQGRSRLNRVNSVRTPLDEWKRQEFEVESLSEQLVLMV